MAVWATALVGLAGIMAAFFAPWWVQTKLEGRRENRAFRRATRLVGHEARRNQRRVTAVVGVFAARAKGLDPRLGGGTDLWDREAGVLASSLRESDWSVVSRAYALLVPVQGFYQEVAFRLDVGQEVSEDDRESLVTMLEDAASNFDSAATILERAVAD